MISKINSIISNRFIKKYPEDLFIKRLRSLVIGEGMLHDGNIYLMDLAIKQMPSNGIVLEIGSYGGLSLNLLIYLLHKNKKEVSIFNCDPWIYEGYEDISGNQSALHIDGRTDISRRAYAVYIRQAFLNSVSFLSKDKLPHTFHLTSNDFFMQYEKRANLNDLFDRETQLGLPISFAYIDGDHDYEQVKLDFENVDRYLLPLGLILFDDSHDRLSFGSAKFMDEMKRNKNYQYVMSNPNYLFKKI